MDACIAIAERRFMVRYHSKTNIIASIDCTIMHDSLHLPIDEKAAAVGRRPTKASAIGDTFIVFLYIDIG